MPSRLETLIELLHSHDTAALATHSATVPGYPFATSLAFATDDHHRPLLLISSLAEHTRNLTADARASLLIAKTLAGGEIARVSLVGDVVPLDADQAHIARYLRYHPEAERFLQFGDFHFHRLEPKRILVVGGFAQAGWLDGAALLAAPSVACEIETSLLASGTLLPPGTELLGIDPFGIDLRKNGNRQRIGFIGAPVTPEALAAAATHHLSALR